jgi:hypothetical protein
VGAVCAVVAIVVPIGDVRMVVFATVCSLIDNAAIVDFALVGRP